MDYHLPFCFLNSVFFPVSLLFVYSCIYSLSLGKQFRCFYYDNATLHMRSTLLEQRKDSFTISNDMFLQLLDLKNGFET